MYEILKERAKLTVFYHRFHIVANDNRNSYRFQCQQVPIPLSRPHFLSSKHFRNKYGQFESDRFPDQQQFRLQINIKNYKLIKNCQIVFECR